MRSPLYPYWPQLDVDEQVNPGLAGCTGELEHHDGEHDDGSLHRHVEAERQIQPGHYDLVERLYESAGQEEQADPGAEQTEHQVLELGPVL